LTDTGLKVLVRGFRIEGATLLPEPELQNQISGLVGKEASFSDLQGAARTLVRYYAAKGYSARVILPEQDIGAGVITLRVIEGRRGALKVEQKGERLDTARIARFIDRRLPVGSVMDLGALGEAMNIVNELPGVSATSVLGPGAAEREVDVTVSTEETPRRSYTIQANNFGSRGTGYAQGGLSALFSNPTGAFDAFSLVTNTSRGTEYLRGDYGVAVGDSGLRVGANASHLDYRLTQSNFLALHATGTASTTGVTASYPLRSRAELDLRLSGGIDRKELVDRTSAGETGDRVVQVANFAMTASFPDTLLGGGENTAEARLSTGSSRQHNAAALTTDRATRNVEGGFGKLEYSFDHVQSVSPKSVAGFSLRGQVAGKNLDSSERMSLGGEGGVRAYPTGEAIGDEGGLVTLSLSHALEDDLTANVFLDHGWIRINHSLWDNWNAANPGLQNSYSLTGVGTGLYWRFAPAAVVRLSIAKRIGDNPGRDLAGRDSDGSTPGWRGWVSVIARF
jgi:hemolysin activation/secretion protein